MTELALPVVAAVAGIFAAWAMTVPLHRYKEFRPKTRRDISAEAGSGGAAAVAIHAAYRQARCPRCHHVFEARDVTPILSWFRGCPNCGEGLARTVPLLQLGVPLAMVLTAVVLPSSTNAWVTLPYLWLVICLAAISLVDLRIWLIPYWMPWIGAAVGLAMIAAVSIGLSEPKAILYALGGAMGSFLLFLVLWFAAPGKLGFGDVRLALLIGMFLAWLHPILPLYGLLFGSVLGLILGLGSLLRNRDSHFPFGPALALGTLCAVWMSGPLLGSIG